MLKYVASEKDFVQVVTIAGTQLRTIAAPITHNSGDTTPYTAGDVVGGSVLAAAAITIASIGIAGQVARITGSRLSVGLTAVPASMTSFTLHLYNATPPSAFADNAVWDLPAGDVSCYCGSVALGTPADLGSTLYIATSNLNLDVQMGATNDLYAYLVTAGGYTPVGSTAIGITLLAQNI